MKRFYKENRVFVILMGVVLICFAIILIMAIKYVTKSSSGNTYGNRLDGISDVLIKDDKINEMHEEISKMKKVESVNINVHGKIVYFTVKFSKDATIEEEKAIAIKSLDFFEQEYRNYYDMQFLFTKKITTQVEEPKEGAKEDENGDIETVTKEVEKDFAIIGYIKAGATTISWSNNAK